ncbi:hypothetical protein F441_02428 [Phytophthora nicotianae CJ01A1]|uniref:Uncharacterized protein n=1 Tax=Phytophthora nicotianae CJ01A1 TaxID=1317063 RepID=W2XRQ9_PHYNI|nr:hypothetical protein F441_02428 [Phytophthora nicotianae CJ01A1]
MATSSVTPGALAFVGPPHLPSPEGFSYLSIVRVQGNSAIVRKTGPDTSDDGPEFDVKLAVLRHRIVESVEAELWPGSYVGHPIAFVQSAGDSSDQWAYGLVTGYSMQDHIAQLHVLHEAQTLCVQLRSTSTVIAIDRLNYALQTGASVNSMVLNALELLDKQNQVIVACGKSRSGLPSCVTSTLLSVPYEPDQRVPLIRPDTLAIAYVRRQHIVDCELTARGKTSADVFKDPVLEEKEAAPDTRTNTVMPNVSTNDVDLTFSDSDDEGNASANTTRQEAIDLVRLQNRPLDKRARYADTDIQELFMTSDADVPTLETRADIHSSMFRPSQVESQVRNAIAHPGTLGKNAQAVLEAAQQARHTRFLSTPPVLRAAYDLSFGIRGLSLMHFRRIFEGVEAQYTTDAVNMANFGRSNSHQPANPPANIGEIVDAFDNLLYFAKGFYNTTVCDFIKTGSEFIVEYAAFARPDASTCTMLVYWINSKLGKFRSLIIASNIQAAALVGREFTRSDGHLMELYQAQQDRHVAAIVASGPTRPAPSTKQHHPREHKTAKASMVPKELLAVLPKQGNKVMCMRYLSKKGCTGPVPGKCFDPNRAHFKPLALPADAKSWIDKHFLGLASDFSDL